MGWQKLLTLAPHGEGRVLGVSGLGLEDRSWAQLMKSIFCVTPRDRWGNSPGRGRPSLQVRKQLRGGATALGPRTSERRQRDTSLFHYKLI